MRSPSVHRAAESGSAYIISLLVLVILSLLGIGLALVTQTELQISSNELMAHRALYAADSGVNLALAQQLTVNATGSPGVDVSYHLLFVSPESRERVDPTGNPVEIDPASTSIHFGERVDVPPFVAVNQIPCDLCGTNVGEQRYYNVTYATVAQADRVAWTGNQVRFNIKPYIPSAGTTSVKNADYDTIVSLPATSTKQLFELKGVSPWPPAKPGGNAADLAKVTQQILEKAH